MYHNGFWYRGTRHLVFFGVTVLFFTGIMHVQSNANNIWETCLITFKNALFFFAYAYITIFLLIPELLLKRKIVWFILLFLLVGVGLSSLKLVFSDYIFYSSISPENIKGTGAMDLSFIVVNTKDMTFIVALFCIAKYVKDYIYADRIRKKLEAQNKEAKNTLLRSQFDPHFMFNTINNLYALSLLNPQKTTDLIRRMKTVLNYIIEESQKDLVVLSDEVKLVENYIQLEKLRYGKRLKVDYEIQGITQDLKIPPLVLFMLVENSFKHGSSLDAGTPWIHIQVLAGQGKIVLSVENSIPKTQVKQKRNFKKGSGFRSLQRRLDLIYKPYGYRLSIENEDSVFKVKIELSERIDFKQTTYR